MSKKNDLKNVKTFKRTLENLGYESIGEFLEIVCGMAALLEAGELESARSMAAPLATQCGLLIEQLDHTKVIKERLEKTEPPSKEFPEIKSITVFDGAEEEEKENA